MTVKALVLNEDGSVSLTGDKLTQSEIGLFQSFLASHVKHHGSLPHGPHVVDVSGLEAGMGQEMIKARRAAAGYIECADFDCPVCSSKEYSSVHKQSKLVGSGPGRITGYRCSQCHVSFPNPRHFSLTGKNLQEIIDNDFSLRCYRTAADVVFDGRGLKGKNRAVECLADSEQAGIVDELRTAIQAEHDFQEWKKTTDTRLNISASATELEVDSGYRYAYENMLALRGDSLKAY